MRILITGAGGFVGSHLCEFFVREGAEVIGLLGPEDKYEPASTRLHQADINDFHALALAMVGVQCVVHAAGPAAVSASFVAPSTYAQAHVSGTACVAQAAMMGGARRLILISSAEAYGAPRHEPVEETDECVPISPYGAAKLGAEWMARAIVGRSNVKLTIVRPFSLYGPRMRSDTVLSLILAQARAGRTVNLHNLAPVRDYLFIEDLANLTGFLALGEAAPLLINGCSGIGISVEALARQVLAMAGHADGVVQARGGGRPVDVAALVGSNARARDLLDWVPQTSLEQGLAVMLGAT